MMKNLKPTAHHLQLAQIKSGFTLIELLIVMSIIAILTGISIFALQGSRESARDAQRRSDLETLRSALEFHRSDCNFYPSTMQSPGLQFTGSACSLAGNVYLESIPDDPNASSANYVYRPEGCVGIECSNYTYWTFLEGPPSLPTECTGFAVPSCGVGNCNYCVANP